MPTAVSGKSTGQPFDDIRNLLAELPALSDAASKAAAAVVQQRGLGRLAELAEWLASVQGFAKPTVQRPLAAIFAATHGISAQDGDNLQAAQARMQAFSANTAPVNIVCMTNDIGLKVFDLAIEMPTSDVSLDDAFDEPSCAATIAFGMEAIAGGTDLLCLGDLGLGNAPVAESVLFALFGRDFGGLTASPLAQQALVRIGDERDPLHILRRIGGRDIAACFGAILASRLQNIPVVLDGIGPCVAAALLHALAPGAIDHCRAAQASGPLHAQLLSKLGMTPLLDLALDHGEATAAALTVPLIRTAAALSAT